jgi:hypothetical protein
LICSSSIAYLRFRFAGGFRLDFGRGRCELAVRAVVRVAAAALTEADSATDAAAPAAGSALSARRARMASRATVRSCSCRYRGSRSFRSVRTGAATKIDEYAPVSTPTNIANAKSF